MQADSPNPYAVNATPNAVVFAEDSERLEFIRRTYTHLTGAILALIGLEVALFNVVPAETMRGLVATMTGGWSWLIVLGAFMLVSSIASSWASGDRSRGMQYAGLGLYVVAEAFILLPLLWICIVFVDPKLPVMAAAITAITFLGITVFVFITRVDLAAWGKYLMIAGFVAMGVIVAGICFGFSLGLWFSGAMVAFASAYIMYQTSQILHHYNTHQYVAAALALFASVVLLFWYVLQIMMSFAGDD